MITGNHVFSSARIDLVCMSIRCCEDIARPTTRHWICCNPAKIHTSPTGCENFSDPFLRCYLVKPQEHVWFASLAVKGRLVSSLMRKFGICYRSSCKFGPLLITIRRGWKSSWRTLSFGRYEISKKFSHKLRMVFWYITMRRICFHLFPECKPATAISRSKKTLCPSDLHSIT